MHEEIRSKLNSGNAYYHSVRIILSSRLLSNNLYTIADLFVVLSVKLGLSQNGKNIDWGY